MKQMMMSAIAATVIVAAGSNAAPFTFTYTGASTLTTEPGAGSIAGGATVGTAPPGLSVLTFQMTADLGVDRPFGAVGPSSWSISDGVHSYLSSVSRPNPFQYFMLATDSLGVITDWDIVVSTYNDATCNGDCAYWLQDFIQLRTINLQGSGSGMITFDQSLLYSAVSGDFGRPWDYNGLSAVAPGNWTMTEGGTGNGVPEPATFTLLGLGLVGLAASRRRRLS